MLEASFDFFVRPFVEFAFMRRALIGCVAITLGAAPLGVFLMLRRMSLTGDVMAHAILPGAAMGYTVAVLSGAVARATLVREDASLAAFYLISLALGVLLISMRGTSIDLMHFLFGAVLALDDAQLLLIAGVTTLTLPVFALIFRALVAECVDPAFLATVRGRGGWVHMVFLTLVVANLVAGFQALGTLLVVGVMMLPAVTARFWARNLMGFIGLAIGCGIAAAFAGLLASFHFALPAGPAIILAAGFAYTAGIVFGPVTSVVRSRWPRKHLTG